MTQFCVKQNIRGASLTGIGAVKDAEIGFYKLENKEYDWQSVVEPMELASMIGNVALVDDTPFIHAHVVLGDRNFHTLGGHLKEAVVTATVEIFLTELEADIARTPDDTIGLNLLDLS